MSRARWMRLLHQWHWISSAVCLVCMVLFSLTGITLNHASDFEGTPKTTTTESVLPAALVERIVDGPRDAVEPLPDEIETWLADDLGIDIGRASVEWSADALYWIGARPGGDATLIIDRASGKVVHEDTDRGWIAWLNDLHKGRDAGGVWKAFIDVFAVSACLFALTGLALLVMHANHRPMTWKITGLGLILPALLLLLFVP